MYYLIYDGIRNLVKMDITVIVFMYLSFFLIWWAGCGYFLFLVSLKTRKVKKLRMLGSLEYPTMAVIVPCLNEEKYILEKLQNLSKLKYPKDKITFFVVDGGSVDGTQKIVQEYINFNSNFKLVISNVRGKILQLNAVLPQIKTEIVVNTDVDSLMSNDSLLKIADIMVNNSDVGVVGGFVKPVTELNWERAHWEQQNQLRLIESDRLSASVVVAACYAFRRDLVDCFPGDVVADDVYVPMNASVQKFRTIYTDSILVHETRAANTTLQLIKHKFRKINANLKESKRFIGSLSGMVFPWNVIYFTRLLQLFLMPWLLVLYTLMFIFNLREMVMHVIIQFIISCISFWFLNRTIKKEFKFKTESSAISNISVALLMNFLLIISHIVYPFYRQSSSYQKI